MNFLNEYNELNPFQYGFRSGHSCRTQLLEMVHQWANTLDRRSNSHDNCAVSRLFHGSPLTGATQEVITQAWDERQPAHVNPGIPGIKKTEGCSKWLLM